MTDETIQTDVSAAGTEEAVVEPAQDLAPDASLDTPVEIPSNDPVSKRERMKAEVAEKRREKVEEDRRAMALINDPDLTGEEYDASQGGEAASSQEVDDDPAAAEPAGGEAAGADGDAGSGDPEPATQADDPNGWRTNDAGDRVKTLMVNGQPREISEEQYDRMLQKDLAGDQKLRMAAEQETVLARKAQEIEERERQLAERSNQPPQGVDVDVKAMIAEHTELLLEGDTDAANAKMGEILEAGRASSTPNIDEIASRVATQVENRNAQAAHDASIRDGWQSFQTDYTDVLADPDAMAFADIQIKKLRTEDPTLEPKDVILKAAQITRDRLNLPGRQEQPTGDDGSATRAERTQRKANLRPLPKASAARHQPKEAPVVDNSPKAKIARMRAGRVVA